MAEAFERIMRGLGEARALQEDKLSLKTTAIEIAPESLNVAEFDPSCVSASVKRDGTGGDQPECSV